MFHDNSNLTVDLPLTFAYPWPYLKTFAIENTHAVGQIPASISNSTSLVAVYASSSMIQGPIPSSLFNLTNLQYLRLSYNNIIGFLPSSISGLRKLKVMNVFQNNLTGEIPESICEVPSIQVLHLAGNHFKGSLPDCIGRLPNLQAFHIDDNSMEGSVSSLFSFFQNSTPYEVGVRLEMMMKRNVYNISLLYSYDSSTHSCNLLEGNIPLEVGWSQALRILNLSHNRLHGDIPMNFGNMSGLESLDLSFNRLVGEIPSSLTKLDFLGSLSLSYNNLSGKIPSGGHFDTLIWDGSAYIGNAFLCGTSIQKKCMTYSSKSHSVMEMEDGKEKWLPYGFAILGYALGFWGPFVVLAMRREESWNWYWRRVDDVALRIIGR
ncbi:Leucine-rich repeat [Cinnamomum micranthum f. kanehirae]|uniref:Leucine-rich repeat n=1 Tax=Cinnamomum micranthum f. kanehirae TaxID=337451 RepID=A0A3S3NH93_9MAGN|nr:Leucine-rich repeat [Cinnamomum micranthum f. kanehirae]